jgi:hypothetical protein
MTCTFQQLNHSVANEFFKQNLPLHLVTFAIGITLHIPGIDVMITFFCDFCQFSAKKLAFFSKKQCYDQSFAKN